MIPENAEVIWRPNAGQQTTFLASTAFEALYGGAAGGGKSDALLMGALRYIHEPGYRALLLRRTFPELLRSLIPKSFLRYTPLGGKPNMSAQPQWRFPSGAVIEFGHLQHDHDVHKYQSAEYQYIGFDELTSFTEAQYIYMRSRLRTTGNIRCCIRAGTNPGGEGHEWVMKRWAPWLDPGCPVRAKPNEKLYFFNGENGPEWQPSNVSGTLSCVFVPARISDNPHLNADYAEVLKGMDRVNRARLLEGDWLASPAAGAYFQRAWFKFIDIAPVRVAARVRRWDLAATEGGGDWTVGVRMARTDEGQYIIEDVVRGRWRADGVEKTVAATAASDGHEVRIEVPQDPGQAGKAQCAAYAKLLCGYNCRFERETGDKVTRAQPFSAQAEAGNVSIVKARWNDVFMQSLEAFPEEGVHDDDVDASSGAFNSLVHNPASFGKADFKSPLFTFGNNEPIDNWDND